MDGRQRGLRHGPPPLPGPRLFLIAGSVEPAASLILVTGAFTREAIVLLWLPVNLTLTVFGRQKVVGRLPVYGAMAVLLVWGCGKPDELAAFARGRRQRPPLASEGLLRRRRKSLSRQVRCRAGNSPTGGTIVAWSSSNGPV